MFDQSKIHPLLKQAVVSRDGIRGIERPRNLMEAVPEDAEPLRSLAGMHIVSARQFDREKILQLGRLAASYETQPDLIHPPLRGKILVSAFYEPSTRTRLSFESAWHRLGGDIMSITDPNTTGIAKGESLSDVGEMFNNYGDVVVLRDNSEDSVYSMLDSLRIPIINAGNGIDEHPTQALADIYAIMKWNPAFGTGQLSEDEKLTIGVIGTPNRMRTVRSLLLLLSLFSDSIRKVYIVNPARNVLDDDQKQELEKAGLNLEVVHKFRDILPEMDVVYINSIAWVGDSYETLTGDIKLTSKSQLKPGAIILHPLARGEELDESLDGTEHNWYFSQARGAVFIRMALLTCLVHRINLVVDSPVDQPEDKNQ
ncbi:MAG TPA: aspartate carbamoyltransferase [Leptospiraceae bacterium]|nr:aspartate carbamoyltransferase [Spirochaetaceae bacterium]HBS05522.1 aspartate carbamoyltransferase [Leptospiraceae bacterium]|tara:strand:- start:7828 stop:8934 length:1107 start_codon:yes stop_codon:yes gene_type:complete